VPPPDIPKPDIPKPDIPKPDIPKPDIPKPDIPAPDIPKPDLPVAPQEAPMQRPAVPTPAEARRIHLKIATETVDPATANGAPAPFNSRFLAGLVDLLVVAAALVAIYLLLQSWAAGVLAPLVAIGYWLTRDCLPILGGRSIGKRVIGLQVFTTDDESLAGNWQAGVLRNVALLVPPFVLVEIYVLLVREDQPRRGIRLGDEWARTKVVIQRPAPAPEKEAAEG
jgi:uncharacterized RDD family membrane protein YckC